jgi:hypothetical protein
MALAKYSMNSQHHNEMNESAHCFFDMPSLICNGSVGYKSYQSNLIHRSHIMCHELPMRDLVDHLMFYTRQHPPLPAYRKCLFLILPVSAPFAWSR